MSDNSKFCGKCGSSLKDNVKFCTNCGTEINEDIAIKRTTRDEFLNRYHGTKILDHINEMIDSNIGDRQRLEAIHHLLESRQDLDYVNFYYLKECSDKYNSIVRPNEKDTIQPIHKPKKKRIPTSYKILGIVWAIFISMIVIGVSVGSNDSDSNEKSTYELEQEKEKEIITTVQQYKGKDGKGETILDVLSVALNVAYGSEDIGNNPSTEAGWSAFIEDPLDKPNIYKVMFVFKTYKENNEFVWYYNTQTKEIYVGNEQAKSLLNIVDVFD